MRSVRLIVAGDQYDRELGFALRGTDTNHEEFMADRTGALVAHDLLEHVNGASEIGTAIVPSISLRLLATASVSTNKATQLKSPR